MRTRERALFSWPSVAFNCRLADCRSRENIASPDYFFSWSIRSRMTAIRVSRSLCSKSDRKSRFLQRIIREGRSKGVVVFFASQSPNDYQQKFFNFQELLEFAFIFQCEGVAPGSVQDILGCSAKTAKELQTEIARLEPWQVITRSPEKTEYFVKFTAEAFYKCYG